MINWTTTIDSGMTIKAARVISQLMEIIMTNTPTTVTTEVMIWLRLWLRVWLTVSTSLVMRESTSPCVVVSKYLSGIRLIFSEMSRRKR
jgi:uncharacterized membrane protein